MSVLTLLRQGNPLADVERQRVTAILPFIEQANSFQKFDLNFSYNATPQNDAAAKQAIMAFICPSNAWRPSATDQNPCQGGWHYGTLIDASDH